MIDRTISRAVLLPVSATVSAWTFTVTLLTPRSASKVLTSPVTVPAIVVPSVPLGMAPVVSVWPLMVSARVKLPFWPGSKTATRWIGLLVGSPRASAFWTVTTPLVTNVEPLYVSVPARISWSGPSLAMPLYRPAAASVMAPVMLRMSLGSGELPLRPTPKATAPLG